MTNEIKNSGFTDRLRYIIDESGNQKKAFAKNCGISENQIYIYLKGTSEPGMKFFNNMKNEYPWVNLDWLINGVGEPKNNGPTQSEIPESTDAYELHLMNLVCGFMDKQRAMNINRELIELEKLDPETFRRVESYVKGTLDTIREMSERSPIYEPDRRKAQRRSSDRNNSEYGGLEQRSGKDRRKYAAQK
jgi:hypothetical protein